MFTNLNKIAKQLTPLCCLGLGFFVHACASSPSRQNTSELQTSGVDIALEDGEESVESLEVSGAEQNTENTLDDSDDSDPDLRAEDFEEGFCADDVYAKYLVQKYKHEHPQSSPPSRRQRTKRRSNFMPSQDLAALSYAKRTMQGATAPYFGAIPVAINQRVDFWLQYFKTAGRRDFMRWLVRGESLKSLVQPILQESGIPSEFFYLAMVESGFSHSAYSNKRATGTWQFMHGTAAIYGLRMNHWIDERRDPVKSTLAAASFLRDLYREFGDWYLAMAAYNTGPGRVRRAMRRTGSHDFWRLVEAGQLAKETANYVPKVLAAVMLSADPKRHGFDVKAHAGDWLPDTEVVVRRPVKLNELANALGLSVKRLKTWNPELIRDIVPPSKHGYSLRLGASYAGAFPSVQDKLSVIEVTDVQMHTIRRGDTLSRIARLYHVGVPQILALNPELSAGRLRIGRPIAVPVPGIVSGS